MIYGVKQTVAPLSDPLTLAEVKQHLRVTDTADDALITSLISAARDYVEKTYSLQLLTATWELKMNEFGPSDSYTIPIYPMTGITSITYVDLYGVTHTVDTSTYVVDLHSKPARITPAFCQIWPYVRGQTNDVTITFTAGFGLAANVPDCVKAAMKLLIGNWYENREATISGTIIATVPLAVDALMSQYDYKVRNA
jgi:uncharacterized phiE125 gp8 family phage protein